MEARTIGREATGTRRGHLDRMTVWAAPSLEAEERIVAAAWGATSLVGWLLGTGKGRIAAVTDRAVHVFQGSLWWRMSRPRREVASFARGSVAVSLRGLTLRIGPERMAIHWHHRGRAGEVVRLATSAPAAGQQ